MKKWCAAKWPLMITNPDGITLNFSEKDYRRWKFKGAHNAQVDHVNQVWADIEVRNFLL